LPWANVETINPTIERPEFGSTNIGRYHALSGVGIISANYWEGDVMYMVLVGVTIVLLYLPLLALIEQRRSYSWKTILLLLSEVCIVFSAVSIWMTERWAVQVAVGGGVGAFVATLKSPGIGLLIAGALAAGLIVLGIIVGFRSVLRNHGSAVSLERDVLAKSQ